MKQRKHDYEEIFRRARKHVSEFTRPIELARYLDINPRTLDLVIRRFGKVLYYKNGLPLKLEEPRYTPMVKGVKNRPKRKAFMTEAYIKFVEQNKDRIMNTLDIKEEMGASEGVNVQKHIKTKYPNYIIINGMLYIPELHPKELLSNILTSRHLRHKWKHLLQ